MADAVLIIPGNITVIPRVNCIFETDHDYFIIYTDNGVKFRMYSREEVLRIILEPQGNDINHLLREGEEAGSSSKSNSNKGVLESLRNNDGEQDGA